MRKLLKAVTCIDLTLATFCWLIIWFIDGTQPDSGYRIVYVICMINAAVFLVLLNRRKKKIHRRCNAYGSRN